MHTPQLLRLAPSALVTLLLTACHGHDATPTPTDSISFADTMTIDEHPDHDPGIVDTATPTYDAPEDTAHHKVATEENDDNTATNDNKDATDEAASATTQNEAPSAHSDDQANKANTPSGHSTKHTGEKKD